MNSDSLSRRNIRKAPTLPIEKIFSQQTLECILEIGEKNKCPTKHIKLNSEDLIKKCENSELEQLVKNNLVFIAEFLPTAGKIKQKETINQIEEAFEVCAPTWQKVTTSIVLKESCEDIESRVEEALKEYKFRVIQDSATSEGGRGNHWHAAEFVISEIGNHIGVPNEREQKIDIYIPKNFIGEKLFLWIFYNAYCSRENLVRGIHSLIGSLDEKFLTSYQETLSIYLQEKGYTSQQANDKVSNDFIRWDGFAPDGITEKGIEVLLEKMELIQTKKAIAFRAIINFTTLITILFLFLVLTDALQNFKSIYERCLKQLWQLKNSDIWASLQSVGVVRDLLTRIEKRIL